MINHNNDNIHEHSHKIIKTVTRLHEHYQLY